MALLTLNFYCRWKRLVAPASTTPLHSHPVGAALACHLQASHPPFSERYKEYPEVQTSSKEMEDDSQSERLRNLRLCWVERGLQCAKQNTLKLVFPVLALRSATVHRKTPQTSQAIRIPARE